MIFGWKDAGEVAREMITYGFQGLFKGYLVFAYKNLKKTGTIGILVISKKVEDQNYMIGIRPFSGGWSGFLPRMPKEYIKEVLVKDLIENKTEKQIIDVLENL